MPEWLTQIPLILCIGRSEQFAHSRADADPSHFVTFRESALPRKLVQGTAYLQELIIIELENLRLYCCVLEHLSSGVYVESGLSVSRIR